jgi:hemerythrin-like domain-containing protein
MTVARRKAAQAKREPAKAEVNPHDALVFLTADHNEIDKLAQEFERRHKAAETLEKGKLALRFTKALRVHGRIKKEVFFPAAEAVFGAEDKELLAKARIEQDELQHLIGKIESAPADRSDFDSAVMVLAERVRRHMKLEEDEIFPRLRHSRLDLVGTGERMAARKAELTTAPVGRRGVHQARKVMGGTH